jgi:AcrR family transcriptional regulator
MNKRDKILDKAFELFSKKGFENTRIIDITNELGIGKGTCYLYFKNKQELLLNSISHITKRIITPEVWKDIHRETDYMTRHKKRLVAFLKVFPVFSGALKLIKDSMQSKDPRVSKTAVDTFKILVNPIRKDFRWASKQGITQDIDEDIAGFLIWGMGEGLGYMLMMDPRYTIEEVAEAYMKFMRKGILSSGIDNFGKYEEDHDWEVTDRTGQKIQLSNIRFNERHYLKGRLGEGESLISMENIASVSANKKGGLASVVVTMGNRKKVTLILDEEVSVTGKSEFGKYTIPLTHVSSISLVHTAQTTNDAGCESGVKAVRHSNQATDGQPLRKT